MKLLDMFCGAGGAAMGYHRAGFEVVGVDNRPQKNYPFEFHQADALEYVAEHGHEFAAIHASPPCQAFSVLRSMWNAGEHPQLVGATRQCLQTIGLPYIIENVPGAPLREPMRLCGTGFGLGSPDGAQLRRHRLFETSFEMALVPSCGHQGRTIGIYGSKARDTAAEQQHYAKPKATRGQPVGIQFSLADARLAMGIDWMTMTELSQAIPPAYTFFIGTQLMAYLAMERRPDGQDNDTAV